MKTIDISAGEAVQQLTLNVRLHGAQMLRFRAWLGARIIRLGAWVIGCGVVIEDKASTIEGQASSLSLKPNDIVVIETQHPIYHRSRDRIAEDIRRVFGEDRKVLVLDGGLSVKVISNDEANG